MRKRFVTALIAGITAIACVFGFTACVDGQNKEQSDNGQLEEGMPVGEEITEEEWKTIMNTPIENYTLNIRQSLYGEIDNSVLCVNSTEWYVRNTIICDDEEYYEVPRGEIMSDTEFYSILKENLIWSCARSEYRYDDDYWHATKTEYDSPAEAIVAFGVDNIFNIDYTYYVSKEAKEEILFPDSFSLFTYENGIYSAKLFANLIYGIEECTVQISFKDGKLLGFAATQDFYAFNGEAHFTHEMIYNNINKTVVTAPKGALDAMKSKENE